MLNLCHKLFALDGLPHQGINPVRDFFHCHVNYTVWYKECSVQNTVSAYSILQ
jgi:hypothetical protein